MADFTFLDSGGASRRMGSTKNWISLINDFYQYHDNFPLSSASILLFHALLYFFSKAFWPDMISPSLSVLSSKCSLSSASVRRARAELVSRRIIRVHENGGSKSASYELIPRMYWYLGAYHDELFE